MSNSDDPMFGDQRTALVGLPVRCWQSGIDPDPSRIEEASRLLGRPVNYVDADGYEQEIVAASPVAANGDLAYVSYAAKQLERFVDVSFEFRVRDKQSKEIASAIKSYNPFFGCDVRFLEWFGETAVLIYREKHDTYIAACTSRGPSRYLAIADRWVVKDDRIGYRVNSESTIRRLQLPKLEELMPISEAQALEEGLCPTK